MATNVTVNAGQGSTQVTVITGEGSTSYKVEAGSRGPTGATGPAATVDQTIIDGSVNAVSGNAVFDALAVKIPLADASITGGANKIPKMDSNGNLSLGPTYTGSTQFDANGNLFIPDLHGLQWTKQDGTLSAYRIYAWQNHDAYGGEFLFESPWRMAFICSSVVQFGNNASARDAQHLLLVSGGSTVSDTMRNSKAIVFNTRAYNGGSEVNNNIGMQGRQLSSDGSNAVLQFYTGAAVTGSSGGYTSTNGDLTGTLAGELASTGLWTPGTAPVFTTLTDGATITQTCSKYKTVQVAKVRLAGNRTLSISGAEAGMRGIIYVKQDPTGSRTLALPTNSVKASGFALSTTPAATDRLVWDYDGTYFYWTISLGLVTPTDADVTAFIAAGRANITDAGIIDALNDLTISAKASNVDGTGTLWSKALFLYPVVGGTSTAHSKDLKAAYDITNSGAWTTGVTHNANGITGDGSTGVGVSAFAMNLASQNSVALYTYCATQSPTSGGYFLGATATGSRTLLSFVSGNLQAALNSAADGGLGMGGDARKHIFSSRTGSANYTMSVNATDSVITSTSAAPNSLPLNILARNVAGSTSGFTNANLRFIAGFSGLTANERAAWRSIVDTFQTSLSRANP